MKTDRSLRNASVLVAAFACAAFGSEAEKLSGDLRQMARRLVEEPELTAASASADAAYHKTNVTRAERRPQISLHASAGYSDRTRNLDGVISNYGDALFSRQLGIALRQLLYDGGAAKRRLESSLHAENSERYLYLAFLERRLVDFAEVYMEVIRARKQVDLARENLGEHESIRQRLQERAQAGGGDVDLALVEGRISLTQTELRTHHLALENSEHRFQRLVGALPGKLARPELPPVPQQLDEASSEKNWEILAALETWRASCASAAAASREFAPKVFAETGASIGEDVIGVRGRDDEVTALLTVSWDIFRGGGRLAQMRALRSLETRAQDLVQAARAESSYRLSLLWSEREGSLATLAALRTYARKLDKVASDYEEQFNVGRRDLLNILDIQNERYSALSKLLNTEFDLDTSAFRIAGNQGCLVGFFGLDQLTEPLRQAEPAPLLAADIQQPVPVAEVTEAAVLVPADPCPKIVRTKRPLSFRKSNR